MPDTIDATITLRVELKLQAGLLTLAPDTWQRVLRRAGIFGDTDAVLEIGLSQPAASLLAKYSSVQKPLTQQLAEAEQHAKICCERAKYYRSEWQRVTKELVSMREALAILLDKSAEFYIGDRES